MKIEITNRKDFLKVLSLCSRIIAAKNIIPISACLKIDVNGSNMLITSFNDATTITHKFNGISTDVFSFCVDAKDFKDAISVLTEDAFTVIVEDKSESIIIKYNKGKMRLPIFSSKDFKIQKELSYYAEVNIDPHPLFDAINEGRNFCTVDELRPIISGLYLYLKDNKMGFAATDMFSIYWKELESNKDIQANFLIPKNVLEILRDILNNQFECDILFSETDVRFRCQLCTIDIRVTEGKFPDVKAASNISYQNKCKVSKNELIEAVRRSSFASDKLTRLVALNICENRIDIQGEDILLAKKTRESITCETNGNVLVGLKYERLLSLLDNIKTENVIIQYNDKDTPVMFTGEGNTNIKMLLVTYQINNF